MFTGTNEVGSRISPSLSLSLAWTPKLPQIPNPREEDPPLAARLIRLAHGGQPSNPFAKVFEELHLGFELPAWTWRADKKTQRRLGHARPLDSLD